MQCRRKRKKRKRSTRSSDISCAARGSEKPTNEAGNARAAHNNGSKSAQPGSGSASSVERVFVAAFALPDGYR